MAKTGLILEGGGMRGLFTAGVIDALIEKHIRFDKVYGVSAGSCHAISYFSGQKDRARRVNVDYCTRPDYFGIGCLIRERSMFGWELIFNEIPNKLDPIDYDTVWKNINNDSEESTDYYVVVTNARTGQAEYVQPKTTAELLDTCKASCSLPFMCKPTLLNGIPYYDGGIADSIPVRKAIADGCEKLVVVLTQSEDFRKKPIRHPALIKLLYQEYPKLTKSLLNRHENYNESLEIIKMLEQQGKAIVLRPPKAVNVTRTERNPQKLNVLAHTGYELAMQVL
ncbi:MAG: patatin family protein [Treponema sp.]|nr:patatin family protein [Treponema sp.]